MTTVLGQAEIQSNKNNLNLGYGVLFEYESTVRPQTDSWNHVFVMTLPAKDLPAMPIPHLRCDRSPRATVRPNTTLTTTSRLTTITRRSNISEARNVSKRSLDPVLELHRCGEQQPFIDFLGNVYVDYEFRIRDIISDIFGLFPNHKINDRVQRGLIDALGYGAKWLFGVAVEDDVVKAAANVKKIVTESFEETKILNHQVQDLNSMLALSNNRMDNVMNTMMEQSAQTVSYMVTTTHTLQSLARYTLLMLQKLHTASLMHADITALLHGLESVAIGVLDPVIVPPRQLTKVITDITNTIKKHSLQYTLISTDTALYYTLKGCVALRVNRTLYITRSFPLSSWKKEFKLYKVKIFDIPIPGNESYTTRVEGLPKFILVASDKKTFLPLDHKPSIENHIIDLTRDALSLKTNSCVIALFDNNMTKINEVCKFVFVKAKTKPSLIRLSGSSVLFVGIEKYALLHSNGSFEKLNTNCKFCIKHIKCGTVVHTDFFVLPAQITDCVRGNSESDLFPIGWALLQKFFSQNELKVFENIQNLDQELQIVLPTFKWHDQKLAKHAAIDSEIKLDLDKFAEKVRNEQTIFDSHSNEIEHDIDVMSGDGQYQIHRWQDIAITVLSCFTIIFLVILVFLIFKISKLSALMLLPTIKATETTRPSMLIYNKFKNSDLENVDKNITAEVTKILDIEVLVSKYLGFAQILLFTLIVVFIVLMLRKILKRARQRKVAYLTQIKFNIGNSKKIVTIDSQILADHKDTYIFWAHNFISNVKVLGWVRPKLLIDWELEIRHMCTSEPVMFQKKIPLGIMQASQIRRILNDKEKFVVIPFLFLGDGTCSQMIVGQPPRSARAENMQCIVEGLEKSAPPVTESHKNDADIKNIPRLYPDKKDIERVQTSFLCD